MITLQHSLATLYGLRGNCEEFDKEIPYVLLPDAIRKYCGPRQYTHFEEASDKTDISWYKFPKTIKNIESKEEALDTDLHLANCVPAAIGEQTHIEEFEAHNQHLSPEYYAGVKKHLTQDCIFDEFIRQQIDCSKKYEDKFTFKGTEYDGKGIRKVIGDIENQGLYILAYMMDKSYGITTNQEWFDRHVKDVLDREYSADLAEGTYKYMHIPEELNKRITEKDWSHLNEGILPLSEYMEMYKEVITEMPKIDMEKSERESGIKNSEKTKSNTMAEGPEDR